MSATEAEMRKVAREEERNFWVGFSLAMLLGLCALNIFVLLVVVPKFGQIYQDALPASMPLPDSTVFILNRRVFLAAAILAFPVVGVILRRRQNPHAILWINLGIIWFFLQLGWTAYALFTPMVGIETGVR